jgi:hypothetical protein
VCLRRDEYIERSAYQGIEPAEARNGDVCLAAQHIRGARARRNAFNKKTP